MILICSQPNLKLNLIKLMICQSFYLIFFQILPKNPISAKTIFLWHRQIRRKNSVSDNTVQEIV